MLKSFLEALKEQDIYEIAPLWGVKISDKGFYSPQEVIVQNSNDPLQARFVWEHLTSDERHLLYLTLEALDTSTSPLYLGRAALQEMSELTNGAFTTALNRLIEYALVYEQVDIGRSGKSKKTNFSPLPNGIYTFPVNLHQVHLTGREWYQPELDRAQRTLSELLENYTPAQLYQLIYQYNLSLERYSSRDSLRQTVVDMLRRQPDRAQRLSGGLSSSASATYNWLFARGGRATMDEVREHNKLTDPQLYELLQALQKYALAFDAFSGQERILFIPKDMLTTETVTIESTAVQQGEPEIVRHAETRTIFDIATLVGLVYQQRIELTQNRTVVKRFVPKIRPLLSGIPRRRGYDDSDDYLEMLFNIMLRLQLVGVVAADQEQGTKSHFQPTARLSAWADMDMVAQAAELLATYTEGYYWYDIVGEHYNYDSYFYPSTAKGRVTLLQHLSSFEVGRWYAVEALLDRIWEIDPTALSNRPLKKNERSKASEAYLSWRGRDAELYLGALGTSIYEMGLVSLGYNTVPPADKEAFQNPDAFQLTELGAAALTFNPKQPGKKAVVEQERTLLVQPNFELLLLQPDLATLYRLFPYTQISQLGPASRLQLTQAAVLKGMERGLSVEHMLKFLEEHSQKELPQNVVYSLKDWGKSYREVGISQILLLELSDEHATQVLCNSSKLAKFGFKQITPTSVITEHDIDVMDLRRALEKEGIVVHIKGDLAKSRQETATYGRRR